MISQSQIKGKFYPDFLQFLPVLKKWKEKGDILVFTNGCFDIIHHGHVDSLLKSASFGTRLIVGLNSDESVRLLKGEGRPVIRAEARAVILAAFCFVDAVILFPEPTPAELIARIVPDILVKGEEYDLHDIAGHETVLQNGGEIKRLKRVPGISSSEIIAKIKKLNDGAD